jgi:hypothetical protein
MLPMSTPVVSVAYLLSRSVMMMILTNKKNTLSPVIYLRPLGSALSAQLLVLVVPTKVTGAIAGCIATERTEAKVKAKIRFNTLTPELNPSAQRYLPRFFYWGFYF